MNATRRDRSLIAWMLYGCVLFNLFACGIHHGQMSGLALSGLDGLFCSTSGHLDSAINDSSGSDPSSPSSSYTCPLCSSFGLALALNSSGASLEPLAGLPSTPIDALAWAAPPPRYSWPSINPRASP
ncbi:DUF2946 family protein [Pseudomonas tumuqii]|uniref:DUF2946 family protein n=1 Tax=Pseudomonas tumuqii TaxID=2715755 RepID=UPI00155384FC|nr:DUF2946 family protein [Pseudomonas tumuqii]